MFKKNLSKLRAKMKENNIDLAIITDDDNLYYFTGYHDFLHMDFNRPTILLVPKDEESTLITPLLDVLLVPEDTPVDKIETWNDGIGKEWREFLPKIINKHEKILCERYKINATVNNYLAELLNGKTLGNITPIINNIRMIKSEEELKIARHAGEVAMAMMEGAKSVIAHNVPQYEIALAQSQAGTRKAAELLERHYPKSPNMSPNIHFLPVITSGKELPYTHRRASTKLIKRGEPVFCCYCGSTNFHRFKLGFDRVFWVNEIRDKYQIKAFEVAVKSQQSALNVLGPGVTAEQVHAAYAETIQSEGYPYPTFRCGRGTGFSFLEEPQLVVGNKTVLKPGMVFAVDGGSSAKDFRGQVGDSFIITEDGYEQITHHSKAIEDLIIN
ncbi:MAG: Creatinase [Alphaproteobacteria bacterium MarineAlpha5_Bin5]|nr:MAG: Creatinase [Alphaproteobacteria bacterium MarineAlpha5_Bin5]|tara:strand:+ start:1585 stop:2739 length:1155 start_codon:yes stop_codon:yes gene_type:complete